MSQLALLPLSFVAAGFILFGFSYAIKNAQAKRMMQMLAVVAEIGAVVIALVNVGSLIQR